ncbi:MAG: 50S ribosomal protein L6 [Chlamydiales bacterium]|nr:50S ribosomal protein L6 [Chlamydiales bacterium]
MSRLAKKPIELPQGTELNYNNGIVTVKGPKGQLQLNIMPGIVIKQEGQNVWVSLDEKIHIKKPFLGLHLSLIKNMVEGVSKGFEKRLQLIGVGYRAAVAGNSLDLKVGYSHPTLLTIPEGIQVNVDKSVAISVAGIDKRAVGQFAADIRSVRPPEPYKGKGIRYVDEFVRKKAGKAAKGA